MNDWTRHDWIEALADHLRPLREAQAALSQQLEEQPFFAYYWIDGQGAGESRERARALIARHLGEWDYPAPGDKRPKAVGAMGVTPQVYRQAERVNHAKSAFRALHEAAGRALGLNAEGDYASQVASEQLRYLLRSIGEPLLDLNATDRRIPLIPGQPLDLRWSEMVSTSSRRCTIEDVLVDLKRLRERYDDPTVVDQDYARLASLNRTMAVCYRPKGEVRSLRFRSRYLAGRSRRTMNRQYASNPILYPVEGAEITPKLFVFESASRGPHQRTAMVSNERVSRCLPHYYWYLERSKKPAKKSPSRRKNPYSPTAFPGLWLGTRKLKNELAPMVYLKTADGEQKRIAIKKIGFDQAWQKAAQIYGPSHGVTVSAIINARPKAQQVADMLAWAQMEHLG